MNSLAPLTDPHNSIREEAERFANTLEGMATEADASNEIHEGVLEALKSSGLIRYTVPAEFGGIFAHVDPFAVCIIREQLMKVCSHADSLFALQGIGSYALAIAGSSEIKREWLPVLPPVKYLQLWH